jgi:flagellar biosynthesis/type III secretory pathway protein FliH
MEFDFDLFLDDFVNTIMYDIENNETDYRKSEREYFLRSDIRETIRSKIKEYTDNIIAELKEDVDQEQLEFAYDKGYDDGFDAALEEVNDSIDKIWITRGRV